VIADTTFLIDFIREGAAGQFGRARSFLTQRRQAQIRTTIISVGEVSVSFARSADAWDYFKHWKVYSLHRGIVEAAADVDRELIRAGARLGENDNWIAGFCRYYRQPIISLDTAFDRVPGLRRLGY
jgi:predicted nucleic acid-binding protein